MRLTCSRWVMERFARSKLSIYLVWLVWSFLRMLIQGSYWWSRQEPIFLNPYLRPNLCRTRWNPIFYCIRLHKVRLALKWFSTTKLFGCHRKGWLLCLVLIEQLSLIIFLRFMSLVNCKERQLVEKFNKFNWRESVMLSVLHCSTILMLSSLLGIEWTAIRQPNSVYGQPLYWRSSSLRVMSWMMNVWSKVSTSARIILTICWNASVKSALQNVDTTRR